MRMIKTIFMLVVICVSSCTGTGNSAGFALQEDLGARTVGLAGACASLSGDVILMHYNPSALAEISDPQLAAMFYTSGLTGVSYISVAYAQKLGKIGTFGVSIGYLDAGQMDLNFIDGTTTTVTSEQDIVANVSMGVNLTKKISAGASLKGMYSTLIGSNSAITAAIDLGALYKGFLMEDVNLGVCLQNLGLGLKYLDTTEPLPLAVQAGVSYNFKLDEVKLLAAIDGAYDLNNSALKFLVGVEGNYSEFFARVGMPLSSIDDRMATAGIGYKMDEFIFDYGITFGKSLEIAHRISIAMKSGEEKKGTRSNKYTPGYIK